MTADATEDETMADLTMKAAHWRRQAARFAGQPEAVSCLDYARHIETMTERHRLEQLEEF